ncbi:aminoglycoside phosphotransferase family protein [Prescottella subtropica]|uniref:aminoglycoside phosphotransferase family protein n=1 Tax=Prescottella subtropica TaxID=2545757 RepID=UPI001F4F1CBA|nr:aminoglycoside phosphotransferase family protein [Prescottella subtropica]
MIEVSAPLVGEMLGRWNLRVTGPPMRGNVALVLPVRRRDGRDAVLKLQDVDDETAGEPDALREWDGDGAARLYAHDPDTGSMLLERLDASRPLSGVADTRVAVRVLAELLGCLSTRPAPDGMRRLGDVATGMLDAAPAVVAAMTDPADARVLADCAAALREVVSDPGDRLLHWDLHFDNVLASDREPWLAIDPKPLAGDPGFELLPALVNRFDADEVRWRFDLMTETLGLDRDRARAWTLARILQNGLWAVEDGARHLPAEQAAIARMLMP